MMARINDVVVLMNGGVFMITKVEAINQDNIYYLADFTNGETNCCSDDFIKEVIPHQKAREKYPEYFI